MVLTACIFQCSHTHTQSKCHESAVGCCVKCNISVAIVAKLATILFHRIRTENRTNSSCFSIGTCHCQRTDERCTDAVCVCPSPLQGWLLSCEFNSYASVHYIITTYMWCDAKAINEIVMPIVIVCRNIMIVCWLDCSVWRRQTTSRLGFVLFLRLTEYSTRHATPRSTRRSQIQSTTSQSNRIKLFI